MSDKVTPSSTLRRRPVMVKVISWTPASGASARYWQCRLGCGHGHALVKMVSVECKPLRAKCVTCTNDRG